MKRAAIAILLTLGGCTIPHMESPIEPTALRWSGVVIDADADASLPRAEHDQLIQTLQAVPVIDGTGPVRVIPSYTFRPAGIAVVSQNAAGQSSGKAKNWLGTSRWEGRYTLTFVNLAGRKISSFSAVEVAGKTGRDAARRACFNLLLADLRATAGQSAATR